MAKILIVDDNKQNVALMKDFVESWGYETILAFQGRDAIELATEKMPDAILLDIMLPGMSGYEVCRELKETIKLRNIPVILVTALIDTEDRVHGFKVGADNFLTKPLPYNELKAMLENYLLKKKQADKVEERQIVVATLVEILQVISSEQGEKTSAQEVRYCQKLAHFLNLKNEQKEKLMLAAELLFNVGLIDWQVFEKLHRLKLANWFLPIINYVQNVEAGANQEELMATLVEAKVEAEAGVLVVMKRYHELVTEGNEIADIIQTMKVEARAKHYDYNVVLGLEQVINDEKIIVSMKMGKV
ncbi:MAG: response regulator [Acidaminococcaceae bacterium]